MQRAEDARQSRLGNHRVSGCTSMIIYHGKFVFFTDCKLSPVLDVAACRARQGPHIDTRVLGRLCRTQQQQIKSPQRIMTQRHTKAVIPCVLAKVQEISDASSC